MNVKSKAIEIAAKLVRQESLTPLYRLSEKNQNVVSMRELRHAIELVEDNLRDLGCELADSTRGVN